MKKAFLAILLLFSFGYCATNPLEFVNNAVLDVFSSSVAYLLSLAILLGCVSAVFFANMNWITVSVTGIVCILAVFKGPEFIKMIGDFSSSYSPQKGVW
ncbi:hypothetical protein CQA57_07095 [Helicobacter anseris]|uniref:VirB2 type IV secretion protein n=1 Tax=Helicobacter anseris TaxID=375926 RepID=A0A3D8J4B7_9HELI|nr:hypothetical protein [Helicobacter anseris]RDU72362.1 hypothetical protein CQA57_07095 [Helicobacter anseris]